MSTDQAHGEAVAPTARRWRWSHFFAGLGVGVLVGWVLGGFQPARPLGQVLAVAVLLGVVVWWVRSRRLRRDGSSFLWGLLLGWPLLVVIALVTLIAIWAAASAEAP